MIMYYILHAMCNVCNMVSKRYPDSLPVGLATRITCRGSAKLLNCTEVVEVMQIRILHNENLPVPVVGAQPLVATNKFKLGAIMQK